jgi:putative ABC transport system permease protein
MASHEAVTDSVEALGFRAFSFAENLKEIQRFFVYYYLGLGIIGVIALFTAALGIVNTMVMSITERRREIGILKSLGAGEREIRLVFLVESGVIGAIGAAVGIFFGWVGTRIVAFALKMIMQREEMPVFDPFALPVWLILLALGFGVFVSLLAGLYPASRAARVDPVVALRSD